MIKAYNKFEVESTFQRCARKILSLFHKIIRAIANRILNKDFIQPRTFTNAMLKHYAPVFTGDIINVSGWKDEDQNGAYYKDYFSNATSYSLSNAGESCKGMGSRDDEFKIDLSIPINNNLKNKYDVVFNHTTLEHIYEVKTAFKNLCDMSRDVVVLIVPVLQQIHFNEGYGDYNRLTTMGVVKSFEENGFETIVLQTNEQQFAPIYCLAIAVRGNSKYKQIFEKNVDLSMGGEMWGSKITTEHISKHISL